MRGKKTNENLPILILGIVFFGLLVSPYVKSDHLLVIPLLFAVRRLIKLLWHGNWYW